MSKYSRLLGLVAALGTIVIHGTPVQAQSIFSATSAVVNSGGTEGVGSILNTLNQSGLAVGYTANVTNFDTYVATNPLHTYIYAGFEWFSGVSSTAVVTYDFGSLRSFDRFALWNEEFSGIGTLNILGSTDGLAYTAILSGLNPPNSAAETNYGATVYSFATSNSRYFRMEMSGCPQPGGGGYNGCSIGEVAFRAAGATSVVPEPSSIVLTAMGLVAVVGAAARRRRA